MKKTQHRDNALTKWLLVLTCLSFMRAPTVCASESLDADFGGFFFGDFYHVPSHHTFEGDSASGAVLRRLPLTADSKFGDQWSGRARLEAYVDWESRPGPYDRSTVQFLVGKKTEQYTLGL